MLKHNVGIDVGGTFTDVLLANPKTGQLMIEKVLSTPENQSQGVMNGLEKACKKADIPFSDINLLFHGTTVVTNMILEKKGARVGFLTTKGHEHILHLARAWTPGPLYGWMALDKPEPLADLIDTYGMNERINAQGEVTQALNEAACREQIEELVESGVESMAIAFLNSYLNPEHEKYVRNLINEMYPDLPVSISSDIVPEYGEYERALTTVINTYTRPQVLNYLNRLESSQSEKGFDGQLNIVRSDGGTMSAKAATERPVDISFSGPSGGVVGSSYLSELIDVPNVLVLDMGGTSTDVSLVIDKEATVKRDVRIGYHEFKSRTVDIHSVGAGGGSIAHLSKSGTLLVGPNSAGADPGPACYGNGGQNQRLQMQMWFFITFHLIQNWEVILNSANQPPETLSRPLLMN
nr:hydantoinase/oxoprolinase family protein [Salicibibacter cibarius]